MAEPTQADRLLLRQIVEALGPPSESVILSAKGEAALKIQWHAALAIIADAHAEEREAVRELAVTARLAKVVIGALDAVTNYGQALIRTNEVVVVSAFSVLRMLVAQTDRVEALMGETDG